MSLLWSRNHRSQRIFKVILFSAIFCIALGIHDRKVIKDNAVKRRRRRSEKDTLLTSCGPDLFDCGDMDASCIYAEYFCDGHVDCPNGADEVTFIEEIHKVGIPCATQNHEYNRTVFRTCLLTSDWICDGAIGQCLFDTDEHCWISPSFDCIVHKSKRCDGAQNCKGNEDEANCTHYACERHEQGGLTFHMDHAFETRTLIDPSSPPQTPASQSSGENLINISEGALCDGYGTCRNNVDECVDTCDTACHCSTVYTVCGNGSFCISEGGVSCVRCADLSGLILEKNVCNGVYDCADYSDEIGCDGEEYFTCNNSKQINTTQTCDGSDDCGDWSDECNCIDSFQCENGKCLHSPHLLCDGIDQCGDGSDECMPQCNAWFKFTCANGNCIARSAFCNGYDDCGDGSDELSNTTTLFANKVMCNNANNGVDKTCVLDQEKWYCDLSDHCVDRADECQADCSHSFRCDNDKCLKIDVFCNGVQDCEDGSDERTMFDYPDEERNQLILCNSRLSDWDRECVLEANHPWVCDSMDHCKNRADECTLGCQHSFHCTSGQCVHRDKVCDGFRDCLDSSDEYAANNTFLCTKTRGSIRRICSLPLAVIHDDIADCDREEDVSPNIDLSFPLTQERNEGIHFNFNSSYGAFFNCVGENKTIPASYICNGKFDCSLMSDECFCDNPPQICSQMCDRFHRLIGSGETCSMCEPGELLCEGGAKCIARKQVCDGIEDCANKEDEASCTYSFTCLHDPCTIDLSCGQPGVICDGFFDCDDFSDECTRECFEYSNYTSPICSYVTGLEFEGQYRSLFNCEGDGKYLGGKSVCDGKIVDCTDGRDELDCQGRFYCNQNKTFPPEGGAIHIPLSQICDGKIDCKSGMDEMNCSQHFYCDNRDPLFVPIHSVMDGKLDCLDGSDECPKSSFDSDTFASKENMIRSGWLRLMVWVMGLLSTIGNLTVIIESLMEFARFAAKRPFAKVHHVLVINLAMADLIMGIYLLWLAGEATFILGSYCSKDKAWRSSSHCEALGTMAVVSSVTSVLILVIMTSYRLYAVLKPFKCQKVNYANAVCFAALAWATGFTLAFLPRMVALSDYFWSNVWISSNRLFKQDVIQKSNLTRFVRILSVYNHNQSFASTSREEHSFFDGSGSTWDNLRHDLISVFGSDVIKGHFGYYSVHSVCMPKIYVTKADKAWEYSLAIVSFHFTAFIFILFAYFVIYIKSSQKSRHTANRQSKMNKRITSLVASDVVCWMPICVMAFLKISGVVISNQVYAISAIVLLPVNSALNPLLYSDALQSLFKKATLCFRRKPKMSYGENLSNEAKFSLTTKGVSGPPNEWRSRMDQEILATQFNNFENPSTHSNEVNAEDIAMLKLSRNCENNNTKDDEESVISTYDNYF